MRKLALEGTSFAGKTILARELERYNPVRYKMIQEFVVYAGGSENFPHYPPKNKKEVLCNLEFFLNLEHRRHADMAKYKEGPYIVIMDRSVISLLGFIFAQKYLNGIDIFCEGRQIIQQKPELAPDFIVYLQTTDAQIKQRLQKSQRKVGNMFMNPEFNRQIRKFFDWLIAQQEYFIISISTDKPIEQVKKELIIIVDQIKEFD